MFNIFKRKRIDYYQYIKSDKWKRKAKACYKRAGYRCQICGIQNVQLQAHHNSYKNLGNELKEDLLCVCADCHNGITKMLAIRRKM